MSRDVNGNYTLPGSVNPVVGGTIITANWGNTTMADVASSLTDSLSRTGQGGMQAPLKATDGTLGAPSLSFTNESTSGFYRASAGDIRFGLAGVLAVGFTANNLTLNATSTNDYTLTVTNGSGTLAVGGTKALKVPSGTTAQRPTPVGNGHIRYNSDLSTFEGYNGAAWGNIGGGGSSGGSNVNGGANALGYQNDVFIDATWEIGQDAQSTCTISIASPAVITQTNTFTAGQPVRFKTTGALPTGLLSNAVYYVIATGLTGSSYQVSTTSGGAAVVTTGTQSGVQTCGKIKNAMSKGPISIASGVTVTIPTGSTWGIS